MQFDTRRLDLTYTLAFAEPLFAVATSLPTILERFHRTIGPRYFVGLDDLQALPGTSLGQVGAKVSLFGGNGTIQLMVDRLMVRFERLQGEADLKIAKDCLELAMDATRGLFPDARGRQALISVRMWLALADGEQAATQLLSEHGCASLASRLRAAFIEPAVTVTPAIMVWVGNAQEQRTRLAVEPALVEAGSHLFIAFDDELSALLAERRIEEQARLVEERLLTLLAAIGLEPTPGRESEAQE
jgi:hypothetical protein